MDVGGLCSQHSAYVPLSGCYKCRSFHSHTKNTLFIYAIKMMRYLHVTSTLGKLCIGKLKIVSQNIEYKMDCSTECIILQFTTIN